MDKVKTYKEYDYRVKRDERIDKLDFTGDGRTHYVYRVSDVSKNIHYYGSRVSSQSNLEDDFWNYGSSGKLKESILKHGSTKYKLKIIKSFDNYGDRIIYESYLHQYFDVRNHERFANKANQKPFGFTCFFDEEKKRIYSQKFSGENNPFFGQKHSIETIEHLKSVWDERGPEYRSERTRSGWSEERKMNQTNRLKENNPAKRRDVKDKMSKAWTQERKTAYTCKYCGMKNNKTNHKRWHNERCKKKTKNIIL